MIASKGSWVVMRPGAGESFCSHAVDSDWSENLPQGFRIGWRVNHIRLKGWSL